MAFSHLRPKTSAAAPVANDPPPMNPEPKVAPISVAAEPIQVSAAPTNVVSTAGPVANPLAAFLGNAGLPMVSARGIRATRAASSGSTGLFPVIRVDKSGNFELPKDTPRDMAIVLPSGKNPATGVILAYRLALVAWPVGFDDRADDQKPAWSAALGADSGAWDDANKAAWKYQYAKKDDKPSFDFERSQIGHINPAAELLVYLAGNGAFPGGLVILATPAKIGSVASTFESLEPYLPVSDDGTPQGFVPFAATLTPKTIKKKSATWSWDEHHIQAAALGQTPECAALLKAFGAWGATLDEETKVNYAKWVKGDDAPLTDTGRIAIAKALSR